ncbi:MAG: Na/Pi symporter [Porticoccaceae bacterium]|nr:Na/Pi symporter [Porticoccaceae bacterium]
MSLSLLLGSIGLFLLGMWLLTEGLKLAGGRALQHMLGRWTSSKRRALAAGVVVTALAQSSSAVTVATIGFVNARLMTFSRSVWVIFGSNVGTTFTAWLVTLFGLKFSVAALTFPMVGVGAFLRVFAPYQRGRALGMALAGFGLLFMGIDSLRESFAGVAEAGWVQALLSGDGNRLWWGFVIGFALTVLTQASVAAIAIILTAIASGLAGLDMALAAVIGANVGTTSTALMASLGATPNAKRLAWAHVLFNLLTGAVALLVLPVFMVVVDATPLGDHSASDLTYLVAIFHTFFNVLGVLVMWPLEPYLSRFLQRRFQRTRARHRAQFLDANVATVPDLAVRALSAQLHDLADRLTAESLDAVARTGKGKVPAEEQKQILGEVETYIGQVSQAALSGKLAGQLTAGLAIRHYLHNAVLLGEQIAALGAEGEVESPWVMAELESWFGRIGAYNADLYHLDQTLAQQHWTVLLEDYHQLKNRLMDGATQRRAAMAEVDAALQLASLGRRYSEQLRHTLNRFAVLDASDGPEEGTPRESPDEPAVGVDSDSDTDTDTDTDGEGMASGDEPSR